MLSTEQLTAVVTTRLQAVGWEPALDAPQAKDAFADLIPAPDAVLTLQAAGTIVPAALYFSRSGSDITYACTLRLPTGVLATERGRITAASTVEVGESRGPFAPGQMLDAEWVAPAAAEEPMKAAPRPVNGPPPRPPKAARRARAVAKPTPPAVSAELAAVPAAAALDHPMLAEILVAITATGWHARRWAELRRSVFPGPEGWSELKAWCASHSLACELCFGGSSKTADVQFRQVKRSAA